MDGDLLKSESNIESLEHYRHLGRKWYQDCDNSMAMYRQQSQLSTPWILNEIRKHIGYTAQIIDINCGAGFFANDAAKAGHGVTALDMSLTNLKVAELYDVTKSVRFVQGDVYKVPFSRGTFDVVVGLDLLTHVSDAQQIFFEASRILRPGGIFFFQAINRNFLTYLFLTKGMNFCFEENSDLPFTFSQFRKPQEVNVWIEDAGMDLNEIQGMVPVVFQSGFWKLPWTHNLPTDFKFRWTRKAHFFYYGFAKKLREQ